VEKARDQLPLLAKAHGERTSRIAALGGELGKLRVEHDGLLAEKQKLEALQSPTDRSENELHQELQAIMERCHQLTCAII